MIVVTAEGDRPDKVPGTPLRFGRTTRNNCAIIPFAGKSLISSPAPSSNFQCAIKPAPTILVCRAGSNECQRYNKEKRPKDEGTKSFAHDAFSKKLRRYQDGRPLGPK